MNRSRQWVWAGVAACLVATLAALGYFWHSSGDRADKKIADALSDVPLMLRWREGSSQQYAVLMDSSFRMNTMGAGASQAGQSIAVHLEGILELRTLEVGPSQALVGMQLSSVALRVSGASDAATDKALGTPFRVRFASSGLPHAFEFPAGLTQEHRDLIENLVRTFQVVVQNGQAWTAQEPNVTGVYEAAYVRNGPSRLQKTKQRFVAPAAAPVGTVPEIASRESIRVDANRDWIAAMTVDETVRSGDSTGLAVDITNRASIELRPDSAAHTAAMLEAWRFAASSAPEPGGDAQVPATTLTRAQALKQIRTDLAALDAAREGRHVWIHSLRDLIRSDGKLPFALLEAMKKQKLSDRTRADLYLVLELAGSPQSQAALRSVIEGGGWTPTDSKRAIIALSGVAKPTTETIETLWVLSRGADSSSGRLAGTATLALGSLGNRLITAQDDRYPSLRSDLLNGALAGGDARQRVDFVHALGNTGDSSLARDIVPLLSDAEPAVRGAAAQSLGSLGTDAVADELLMRLSQEKVGVVRGAIAEALASWTSPTPAAVASIRAEIRGEREESSRFAMAQILGKSLATYPQNREVLQALLQSEQSERIRREVAAMLAAGK